MVGYALFNGPSAFQADGARSRAKQQQQQQPLKQSSRGSSAVSKPISNK
jgi:hypothetical protein